MDEGEEKQKAILEELQSLEKLKKNMNGLSLGRRRQKKMRKLRQEWIQRLLIRHQRSLKASSLADS